MCKCAPSMLDYALLCCDSLVCESRCWVPAPTELCANHLIKVINCLIAMFLTFGTHWTTLKLLDYQTSKDQNTLRSHRLAITFRNQLWLAWFALVELTFIGCIISCYWLWLVVSRSLHFYIRGPVPNAAWAFQVLNRVHIFGIMTQTVICARSAMKSIPVTELHK